MWIETKTTKTGQTKYKYCDRFPHPVTGKPVRVSVTLSSKSRHAQKEAAQLLQDEFKTKTITAGQQRSAKVNTLTMAVLCNEWLAYIQPSIKPQTLITRQTQLKKLLSLLPQNVLFLEVTPPVLEKALSTMYYKEGRATSYVFAVITVCKQLFRYAKKSRYIDDIRDYEDIDIKKRPLTAEELQKKANKFLNADELADCLEQIKKTNMRVGLAMEFISLTGLRLGELLALRFQDCDLQSHVISINGNMYALLSNSNPNKRGTPKNVFSYRTVYINQRAINIIKWFKVDNMRLLRWTKATYEDKGYIFTGIHGAPLCDTGIYNVLHAVTIPDKHITPHIFRHTYISMLAEKNTPLKAIMQQVGHHAPQTTLAIYTHVTDAMTQETKGNIDELGATKGG